MAQAPHPTSAGWPMRRSPSRPSLPATAPTTGRSPSCLSGIGTIGTALNIVATTICMRCPGMKLSRMPLLVWLYLVMSGLVFVTISPLTAAQIMLMLDRYVGSHFFDTQAGGSAVLWMHFFWIFGHPEVYVLVLPAFAFANEIIPVFSRKAIFGYPAMVAASVGIGFISLSVWAHHMFTVGMTSGANTFFVLATMAISVPTGIKIFNWLATHLGRQDSLHRLDDVCHRLPLPVPHRGPHRHHVVGRTLRLAARRTPTSSSPTSTMCWSARFSSCSSPLSTTGIRR